MLDTYSWDQIAVLAECIVLNRIDELEQLLSPIAGALGRKYKRGRQRERSKKREREGAEELTAEQRDTLLVKQLEAMGFPVD